MKYFATPRLIEASATLDPSSRALLNIWLHRDLSDEAIARMARIPAEDVAVRKRAITLALAETLNASPAEVTAALDRVTTASSIDTTGPQPVERTTADETPDLTDWSGPTDRSGLTGRSAANGQPAATTGQVSSSGARTPAPRPDHRRVARRRRGVLAGAGALLVAAIVVVVVLVSSGGDHRVAAITSSATPTGTAAGSQGTGTTEHLSSLSLQAPAASGTVSISHAGAIRVLDLSVIHLPRPSGGRYEVWLYDSIINARPLGFLAPGASVAHFRLPSDAARYREIDISLQAAGAHYNSGESYLRAPNPVG